MDFFYAFIYFILFFEQQWVAQTSEKQQAGFKGYKLIFDKKNQVKTVSTKCLMPIQMLLLLSEMKHDAARRC